MDTDRILAMLPKASFPGQAYFGRNSLMFLKSLDKDRTLILACPSVLERHKERLGQTLSGFRTITHKGEPRKTDLEKLRPQLKGIQTLVGLGGGSVMDLAKAARLDTDLKLILIPTTAGTGAEVSRYSVLINEQGDKEALVSERLIPDIILLDHTFLTTLPAFETFCTTMDSLAHCLEGLVSRMSNPFTDAIAIRSIDMLIPSLEKALESPEDPEAREGLQVAGFLAGLVASSASVGLVHSFAHYFGPRLSMPHGLAVGMFLRDVLKVNMERTDRYSKLDSSCHLRQDTLAGKLDELFMKAGFDEQASRFDFSGTDMEQATQSIRNDACTRTNPFMPSPEDIRDMLRRLPNVKDR